MAGRIEISAEKVEYWFTIIAFVVLSNALSPAFDVSGAQVEGYTDSNPLRLVATCTVYLICGALCIYRWGITKQILFRNLILVAIYILPVVSLVWSADPQTTMRRAAAHLLTGCLCIYIAGRMTPEEFLRRLMVALLIGGIASLLYVVAVPSMGIHQGGGIAGSWKGVYGHKNELGRVSSIAIITSMFVISRTKMEEYIRLGTIALFLFLLLMCQSRTNWFILSAMFAVVPAVKFLRNKSIGAGIRLTCFLTVAVVLALGATVGAEALLTAVGRDATFSGRTTLWQGVNTVIAAKYPYLGAGYGAFFTPAGAIYDLTPYLEFWGGIPNHAHNGYLNTRADLGIPGLVALTLFILIAAVRLLNRVMVEVDRKVWTAFCALFFLFLVNNFSESVAFKHSDIAWVAIMVICAYALPVRVVVRRRAVVQQPRPVAFTGLAE